MEPKLLPCKRCKNNLTPMGKYYFCSGCGMVYTRHKDNKNGT